MEPPLHFLELIAHHSHEPMMEFDGQGVLQHANRAADQLFRYHKQESQSLSNLYLTNLEGESVNIEYLRKKFSHLPEIVQCQSDNQEKSHLFSLSASRLDHPGQTSYFLVLTPFSGSVQEAEVYRLAEEKFYKAFHLSPDAISITRLKDGKFLDVNEGFIHLTGYSRDELIGKSSLKIGLWNEPQERENLIRVLQIEGSSLMNAHYRIKNGELAEGQISAKIINIQDDACLISVVRDLRGQRRIENELRERERKLRVINQATNDAIWDWNVITGELVWNDGLSRIFGYDAADIEPTIHWWEDHIHEEDRERVVNRIRFFVRQGEESWFDKYRFVRKDGSFAYVYDKGHIVVDEANQPVRMIGGMVDITDRILAEESLVIRNKQIAEYAFFNSHRVRGPLSRLLGLANLIDIKGIDDQEQRAYVEKMRLAAEEMDTMIREITKIFY